MKTSILDYIPDINNSFEKRFLYQNKKREFLLGGNKWHERLWLYLKGYSLLSCTTIIRIMNRQISSENNWESLWECSRFLNRIKSKNSNTDIEELDLKIKRTFQESLRLSLLEHQKYQQIEQGDTQDFEEIALEELDCPRFTNPYLEQDKERFQEIKKHLLQINPDLLDLDIWKLLADGIVDSPVNAEFETRLRYYADTVQHHLEFTQYKNEILQKYPDEITEQQIEKWRNLPTYKHQIHVKLGLPLPRWNLISSCNTASRTLERKNEEFILCLPSLS